MGSSLHEMAENAKQATKLQQQLAEGRSVISVDTSSIDSSKIVDRIPFDIDPDFNALVESIAEHGQQVPILVRPNPQVSGRFRLHMGVGDLKQPRNSAFRFERLLEACRTASSISLRVARIWTARTSPSSKAFLRIWRIMGAIGPPPKFRLL